MRLIYKPFGIVLGVLSGIVVARPVFNQVWGAFADEEPPDATTRDIHWAKLLLAAAVQGMVFRVVRVLVDRGLAKVWAGLTGTWPGEKRPART